MHKNQYIQNTDHGKITKHEITKSVSGTYSHELELDEASTGLCDHARLEKSPYIKSDELVV